jgi:hypothetical protein
MVERPLFRTVYYECEACELREKLAKTTGLEEVKSKSDKPDFDFDFDLEKEFERIKDYNSKGTP